MNLGRFIPNKLKAHIIGIQINTVSRVFLSAESLLSLLVLDLFGGGKEILCGTVLFPEEGFYVADVGAYRGWFTAISSKIVGSGGRVYSFEPEPVNFEVLRKVVFYGNLENVDIFRLALSDKDGFEFLYLSEHPSMHSLVPKRSHRKITVPCTKLDTIVKLRKIQKLDLIKIDVEGAELKVLKGCNRIVNEYKPIFSIDVNHYDREFEEVYFSMLDFGYEIHPLFGETYGRPYSIVAFPSDKRSLAKHLINKTRKLTSVLVHAKS
jgi:FkbM family methyltransferase